MTTSAFLAKLGEAALRLPEAARGLSCAGTALETPTVTVRKKAFLFIGRDYARSKLAESVPLAEEFAAQHPGHLTVGAGGWTRLRVVEGDPIPAAVIDTWIKESYRLMAPSRLLAAIDSDPP